MVPVGVVDQADVRQWVSVDEQQIRERARPGPALVRWPCRFKPGTVLNGIVSHQNSLPTLLAAAGQPPVKPRAPKLFNLRRDPFERTDQRSNTCWDWDIQYAYAMYAMQGMVADQIEAFKKLWQLVGNGTLAAMVLVLIGALLAGHVTGLRSDPHDRAREEQHGQGGRAQALRGAR
jgi:hypothetical protein